jgi:lipoate-protein ligase A
MILWCDGGHSARDNMRRDRRLLERLVGAADGSAEAEATLRLFRFAPPGITLGHAQDPSRTLDLERCEADGVEWAVRPTGGRAIFHDEEWTYSVAARIADPDWGGDLRRSYQRVSGLIHASLVALGVPADRSGGRARVPRPEEPPHDPARPSCFASTSRHEIELAGSKLVGSAQRRSGGALLQQGSVLLGPSHVRLADYLRVTGEARDRARQALAANATTAEAYLGSRPPLERWADAIAGTLGDRARRVSGADGALLLTPSERAPYTAASA